MSTTIQKTASHTVTAFTAASTTVGGVEYFPTYLVTADGTSIGAANALHVQPGTGASWAITAAALPLPSGAAIAAKQPAIGTAGTPSVDVISIQGVVSGTVVPISDGGGSITVDGSVSVSGSVSVTNAGTFAVQVDGTALTRLTDIETNTDSGAVVGNGTAATAQRVTLASDSTGTVTLGAGTAAIGKLAANSGVTIGAVEIASAQTLATVTTVSTVSTLTGGGVAHDGADSGNPIKVGARAVSTLATATMVSAADRADAISDLDGAHVVRGQCPLGDVTSERVTDTGGTSTAFSNFGATAGTRNYVTAIAVYNSSATAGTVDFRDGTGGAVLWTMPIPAGGGSVLSCDIPLFRTSANTALAYDVSGALTTVTISVSGFRSKV